MNKSHSGCFTLSFPEAKGLIISGDIHRDFNQLVFKLCVQYQMRDTLLIVAGDCGFGFEKERRLWEHSKTECQAHEWSQQLDCICAC